MAWDLGPARHTPGDQRAPLQPLGHHERVPLQQYPVAHRGQRLGRPLFMQKPSGQGDPKRPLPGVDRQPPAFDADHPRRARRLELFKGELGGKRIAPAERLKRGKIDSHDSHPLNRICDRRASTPPRPQRIKR
jgi:hypothetical protein